jgi:hypothetical protein
MSAPFQLPLVTSVGDVDEWQLCEAGGGDSVCEIHGPGDEARAKFIRKAVNHHDELVAALRRLVGEHADLGEVDLDSDEREALENARTVLNKIEQ